MKKFFGVLAFSSFIAVFGTVGAIEQDMISLGRGVIYGVVSMACLYLFTWLAGGFDPYCQDFDEDEEYEESRPRKCEFRKAASVNAHTDYIRNHHRSKGGNREY